MDQLKRRIVWQCSKKHKVKGEKGYPNKHIDDRVLYQTFINTFNAIIENKDYFIEKWKNGLNSEDIF